MPTCGPAFYTPNNATANASIIANLVAQLNFCEIVIIAGLCYIPPGGDETFPPRNQSEDSSYQQLQSWRDVLNAVLWLHKAR